ncbi:hypothetical protein AAVH_27954 [Aphelenchoides avenae]|nr:hypothetical protein AAVH_27954 [Aphelenchus avenae]
MASDNEDLEPDLYCNIDDDENSKYIVPAGTHATSRRRKSWPGPAASAPLAEAESSQQQPNSSKPAALAVRETTGQEPTPSTTAKTADSGPAPLAGEDSGKEQVVSTTTEAADDTQEMPNPSGPAPLAGEESGAAQASSCSAPLAVAASVGALPAQPTVVSKQQRKAAALSKILGKGQPRQLQPPAPKKIIIKLKDRKPQPAEPVLPKQPPKPRPIVELSSARDVRTVAALVKATKKKYFQWMKKQPPGPPPPAPFTDESWKTHKYGRILWAEYCQLAPAIRIREIADKKAKSATATTSQLPSAIAAPSTTAAQQHLDEWAQQFLPSTSSAANEMTEAEARQAEATILGANKPQQLDEEIPFVLAPPPQPPNLDEIMEGVSELFQPPQAAKTRAAAPGPFRNQSPPPTPRDPRLVRRTIVPPPPPPLAKSPPALTTSPTAKVRQWLHSSVAPSARQSPQKTKEAARSQETSQSGSRESRQQSGKRAHTATGTSVQPPTHRRREVSTSPVRDQSPGIARKNRFRAEAKRPPIPLIDGCMNKDIGIFYKRTGRDLANQQWHQVLDKSNDHLIFLGGINEIGIPGVYLPVDAYQPLQPNAIRPIADLKRAEFDAEQTIIPQQYILCNTFGTYPRYAEMVTSQTRQHFYVHTPPTEKYHAGLRFGGVGPTGYDLRIVPDNVYFDVVAAQRTALVRYARIARKTKRCLRIYIQCSGPGPNGFNLHADAIRVLLKVAKLDSDHPIHLVKYNGTTMDVVRWLEPFPNLVFGISPYTVTEHLAILAKYPTDSLLYKDTDAMRTLLRRMPLRNLAIQARTRTNIRCSCSGSDSTSSA